MEFADVVDPNGKHMRIVERDGEVYHQKVFLGDGRKYDAHRNENPKLPLREASNIFYHLGAGPLDEFLNSNEYEIR